MKTLLLLATLSCAAATSSFGQGAEYVQGHLRSDGTYVSGYYRTHRDSTPNDNYSYQGNYNPYTGSTGTRQVDQGSNNGQRAIYQGREVVNVGGQWYYVK